MKRPSAGIMELSKTPRKLHDQLQAAGCHSQSEYHQYFEATADGHQAKHDSPENDAGRRQFGDGEFLQCEREGILSDQVAEI